MDSYEENLLIPEVMDENRIDYLSKKSSSIVTNDKLDFIDISLGSLGGANNDN